MSSPPRRFGGAVLWGTLVFVLALGLRVGYVREHHEVLGLDVSRLSQTDNFVFAQWARTIADGDWLCRQQPHAWHLWTRDVAPQERNLEWYGGEATFHQSPLYPYFVAAVYVVAGRDHEMVGYAQALLGALTCLLTYLLALRLVSLRAGILAGMLLAFCGPYYFYDAFVLRDGLMALMVVVLALALERAVGRGRARDWLLAGAALGLFTLAKETGTALLGLTLLGTCWALRREPGRALATGALVLAGWLAVLSPALVRNHELDVPLFKLSTRGPEVLVAGNARGQDGVSWSPPTELMRDILVESNFGLVESGLLTLASHRADPLGFLALVGNKTRAYFNGYEVPNNVNFYLHRSHLTTLELGFVSVTFLGPAALLGLLLAWPRRRRLAVPYLLFGAISLSVIALYILARFRLQVFPLLAFFSALSLDWAWEAWRARRRAALVLAGGLFGLLVWWCWPSEPDPYEDFRKYTAIMLMHLKVEDVDQAHRYRDELETALNEWDGEQKPALLARLAELGGAFEHFEAAAALPEHSAERHLELGQAYVGLLGVTKRAEQVEMANLARRHYKRALELRPGVAGALHGLARIEAALGDQKQAIALYRQQLASHPRYGPSHRELGTILFVWGDLRNALLHLEMAIHTGDAEAQTLAFAARCQIDSSLKDFVVPIGEGRPAFDLDSALARARQALELAPEDGKVMEHAASVLYSYGNAHDDPGLITESMDLLERLAVRDTEEWRRGTLVARREAFDSVRQRILEAGAAGSDAAPGPTLEPESVPVEPGLPARPEGDHAQDSAAPEDSGSH